MELENLRSFTVTYMSWTNTKPARVKIYDNRFRICKYISYHYDGMQFTAHEEIAAEHLRSLGIPILYRTQGKHGFLLLTRNF